MYWLSSSIYPVFFIFFWSLGGPESIGTVQILPSATHMTGWQLSMRLIAFPFMAILAQIYFFVQTPTWVSLSIIIVSLLVLQSLITYVSLGAGFASIYTTAVYFSTRTEGSAGMASLVSFKYSISRNNRNRCYCR